MSEIPKEKNPHNDLAREVFEADYHPEQLLDDLMSRSPEERLRLFIKLGTDLLSDGIEMGYAMCSDDPIGEIDRKTVIDDGFTEILEGHGILDLFEFDYIYPSSLN